MVINGSGNSNVVTTTVPVVAGRVYEFSVYAMNLVSVNSGILPQIAYQYSLNGGSTWNTLANAPALALTASATWVGSGSRYLATTTGNILIRVFSIAPAGGGNDFAIDELQFQECTLPTVRLTKVSNGAVGAFTFTGTNGWTSQTITTATSGVGVTGAGQVLSAANTQTDITETLPAGYTLDSITCTGLGSGGTATPNLTSAPVGGIPAYSVRLNAAATAAGANIECTFTNNRTTLQLAKAWGAGAIVGNVADIGATTGGTNNTAAFTSTASTNANSGAGVNVSVGNTITLPAETMSTGTLDDYNTVLSCTANGAATANALSGTNGQVSNTLVIGAADAGKAIVCTYTNTRRPRVTLTKISNGSVGPFTFTGTNGWASQTITTATSGVAVAGALQRLTAANTETDISETLPAGYELTSITCSGLGAGTATPNLTSAPVGGIPAYSVRLSAAATAAGANIGCTFTNTLRSVDLSITKTNNLPGTVDLPDDTLTRGQTTVYRIVVTNNGPQSVTGAVVTDPAVSGLTCTSLTCTGTACPSPTPAVSALQAGLTLGTLAVGAANAATLNLTCTVN